MKVIKMEYNYPNEQESIDEDEMHKSRVKKKKHDSEWAYTKR